MSELKIHFLGAAETVTGSKFYIETPEKNILIDCGVFQGLKKSMAIITWNVQLSKQLKMI